MRCEVHAQLNEHIVLECMVRLCCALLFLLVFAAASPHAFCTHRREVPLIGVLGGVLGLCVQVAGTAAQDCKAADSYCPGGVKGAHPATSLIYSPLPTFTQAYKFAPWILLQWLVFACGCEPQSMVLKFVLVFLHFHNAAV